MNDEPPRELTNRLAQARDRTPRLHLLMPETNAPLNTKSVIAPSGRTAGY